MGGHSSNHDHAGHSHADHAGHGHADAWHHHDLAAEGLPQVEHTASINTGRLAQWFVILVLFVTLFIGAVATYFNGFVSAARSAAVETDIGSHARTMRNAAFATLGQDGNPETYDWADANAGKVQLPIEKAMTKVIERYGKEKR